MKNQAKLCVCVLLRPSAGEKKICFSKCVFPFQDQTAKSRWLSLLLTNL